MPERECWRYQFKASNPSGIFLGHTAAGASAALCA